MICLVGQTGEMVMTVTIETLDGKIFHGMKEEEHRYCKIGTEEDICIPKINVKSVCEE